MTESEQTQALKAAFPAEPASGTLKQRVANLTPLQPVVTGYKFKFRHVFAIFAVLWIGHNIPIAIKVTKQSLAPNRTHIRMYKIKQNLDGTGMQRVLFAESWGKDRLMRSHTFSDDGRQISTTLFLENAYYSYNKEENTLTITHSKMHHQSFYEKYSSIIVNALPILLLRTHDNRPSEFINGKEVRISQVGDKTLYSDPKTESLVRIKNTARIKNLVAGETFMEVEKNISIPDSIFTADFPKDAKLTENWPKYNGKQTVIRTDHWAALTEQVKQYTLGQHP